MECHSAYPLPLEPLLCHSNHWDATQGESHFTGPSLHSTASSQDEADRSLPCIYREATDQPGPEMNSISNISQFCVTLPLDCHSDHCKDTVSISAKYSASAKFEPTQCTATVPLQSHCVTEDPLEPNLPQWISKYANGLPIRQCHVI